MLCAACAGPGERVRFVAPDYAAKAPLKVALLPFDNQSVDLIGPEMVRGMVQERLGGHGFDPLGLDAVDAGLHELGIDDGGQLPGVTAETLARTLGVRGLFYGTLEEFTMQNVGFAARRSVRLRLRLVLAPGGERLWEDTGLGRSGSLTLDKKTAGRVFFEGLAVKGVETLFRTPLMPESRAAVQDLFSRLPRR